MINGPLAGIFLLGGLTRLSNARGVFVGVLCAMVVMTTVTLGSVSLGDHQNYLPMGQVNGCQYNFTSPAVKVPKPLLVSRIGELFRSHYVMYFIVFF